MDFRFAAPMAVEAAYRTALASWAAAVAAISPNIEASTHSGFAILPPLSSTRDFCFGRCGPRILHPDCRSPRHGFHPAGGTVAEAVPLRYWFPLATSSFRVSAPSAVSCTTSSRLPGASPFYRSWEGLITRLVSLMLQAYNRQSDSRRSGRRSRSVSAPVLAGAARLSTE